MKTIGIDARFYGTEQKGLGRYVQKLVEELARLDTPLRFKIFLSKKGIELYRAPNSRFLPVLMDVPWYGWPEQIEVPKILTREQCDLVHFPHFNVPYAYRRPYVMTIHDLILFDHPSRRASQLFWPLYQLKYAAFKLNLRHALNQSRRILTVSEHTKSRVEHYFSWTKNKITVTPIAPGHAATATTTTYTADDLALTNPYILYVGNAYPHKNLAFLIKAFHAFKKQQPQSKHQLILVGKLDAFYFSLQELIDNLEWTGSEEPPVKIFGYATEAQLAALYQHAAAYVFPSLEEGFGIPPLEAMQYGIPVLSSDQGSMLEVLGSAALYFNPRDPADFIDKLNTLLTNASLRQQLISAGKAQTSKYSWKTCAEQTLKAYEQALKEIS